MNRQPAGIPTGGQFSTQTRAEAGITLTAGWPEIPVPNEDQLRRAAEEVDRRLAWEPSDTQVSDAERDSLAESIATRLAEQEASYEAWKRGETHEDDDAYAAIWNGETNGFGRIFVETELAATRKMRADLNAGVVKPRHVIGTGYKAGTSRKLAEEWLDKTITRYEEALRCEGRNLTVNQSNVFSRKRRAVAEAAF